LVTNDNLAQCGQLAQETLHVALGLAAFAGKGFHTWICPVTVVVRVIGYGKQQKQGAAFRR
jgi:hypothetical protein